MHGVGARARWVPALESVLGDLANGGRRSAVPPHLPTDMTTQERPKRVLDRVHDEGKIERGRLPPKDVGEPVGQPSLLARQR